MPTHRRTARRLPPPLGELAVVLCMATTLGTACLEARSTRCPWGLICPPGRICDPVGETCIHPSQELICRGLPDGEPCTPEDDSTLPHLCVAEVCRRSRCGDGLLDPRAGEECDDGNDDDCDGCRSNCTVVDNRCGDGIVCGDEVCDDGNKNDFDQCTQACLPPRCGDRIVSGLEECDNGDENSATTADACRPDTCVLPACADGVVDSPDLQECWSPSSELVVTTSPSRILAADLNGDGRDDLIVWSGDRVRFEVYLSQGDGSVVEAPGSPHLVGYPVLWMTVGDLNNDMVPDVVLTRETVPSAQTYLGDGTGRLTLDATVTDLTHPLKNVVLGDFDGDERPDLVALYDGDCEIDISFGQPDGTFAGSHSANAGLGHCWSEAIRAADMNGDGLLDVVVAGAEEGVFIMQGDGLGHFVSPNVYLSPKHPGSTIRDVAVLDVNGDGLPDLLYPEQYPPQTPLRVLLNQGDFQFIEAPDTPVLLGVSSLRFDVGDLDGNGTPDLAVIDLFAAAVFLVLNHGDATFSVMVPTGGALAQTADDVAFGHFVDSSLAGLALLKIGDHRVTYWAFGP